MDSNIMKFKSFSTNTNKQKKNSKRILTYPQTLAQVLSMHWSVVG